MNIVNGMLMIMAISMTLGCSSSKFVRINEDLLRVNTNNNSLLAIKLEVINWSQLDGDTSLFCLYKLSNITTSIVYELAHDKSAYRNRFNSDNTLMVTNNITFLPNIPEGEYKIVSLYIPVRGYSGINIIISDMTNNVASNIMLNINSNDIFKPNLYYNFTKSFKVSNSSLYYLGGYSISNHSISLTEGYSIISRNNSVDDLNDISVISNYIYEHKGGWKSSDIKLIDNIFYTNNFKLY